LPLASYDEPWYALASRACQALGLEEIWIDVSETRWRAWYTPEPIVDIKVSDRDGCDEIVTRSLIHFFGDDDEIAVYMHHKRDLDFAILNREAYTRLLSIIIGYLEVSMKVYRKHENYFEEEKYD
jgi:hypothetical protein